MDASWCTGAIEACVIGCKGGEEAGTRGTEGLIEHYVESYDNQGFPKPSGYIYSVAPHFKHVLELLEVLDP